jgi:hypothetical protein
MKINNYTTKKIGYAGLLKLSSVSENFDWQGLETDGYAVHEINDDNLKLLKESNLLSQDEVSMMIENDVDLIVFTS